MFKRKEVLLNIIVDMDRMQEHIIKVMYDAAIRSGQPFRVRLATALLDEFYNQKPDPSIPPIEIAGLMHSCVVRRGSSR